MDFIKAKACSLDAGPDGLTIRLTFVDADGARQVVEYVYSGTEAPRFAKEIVRQHERGEKMAAKLEAEKADAAPVAAEEAGHGSH